MRQREASPALDVLFVTCCFESFYVAADPQRMVVYALERVWTSREGQKEKDQKGGCFGFEMANKYLIIVFRKCGRAAACCNAELKDKQFDTKTHTSADVTSKDQGRVGASASIYEPT